MKLKALVVALFLSVMVTIFSLNLLATKIVIQSTGKASAKQEGKTIISYGCDNSDNVKCTITIFPEK